MQTSSRAVVLGLVACSAAVAQSPLAQSRFASIPATFDRSAFRCAESGDIDGDGDLDLLLGNAASPVSVYVNDGNGRFTDESAARLVSPLPLSCASIDLVDIDGDGDLDALLGNRATRANQVHLNNGLGVFTYSPGALPPQGDNTWSQVVADFDGDGDVDWLALNSSSTFNGNTSRFYENDGAGAFADVTAAWLPVAVDEWSYLTAEPATDLNGDGLLDVLTPAGTLLLNTGSALAPSAQQLPSYAGPPFLLRDVDGDGHVDVLASGCRDFFRNLGDGTFVDASAGSIVPASSYFVKLCCDLDGDGDVDILRPYTIDWNDGGGVFSSSSFTAGGNFELDFAVGDWDGDGDLEPPGWVNLLRHVDAAAAPQRGGIYDVSLHGRPGSAATPGLLFAALGSIALPLPGYGTLRLDPASMTLLGAAASTSPAHTVQLAVPNVPALAGTTLHLQAAVLDPLDGLRLTNAIADVVP